jgi:hypothetical protein
VQIERCPEHRYGSPRANVLRAKSLAGILC